MIAEADEKRRREENEGQVAADSRDEVHPWRNELAVEWFG